MLFFFVSLDFCFLAKTVFSPPFSSVTGMSTLALLSIATWLKAVGKANK